MFEYLQLALDTLIFLFLFWLFFVVAIKGRDYTEDKSSEKKWAYRLFVGIPFLISDFLVNLIFGSPLYMSWPDFKGARYHFPLFTHRLQQSLLQDPQDSYQYKLSKFICSYIVEPVDFGHCKLASLRDRIEEQKSARGFS